MFQREFALRLVAKPNTELWSRLSANVQLYAKVDLVMHVGKNNFRPPPKVESSVIRLVPLDPPPPVEFGEFDGLGRIIFSRRNKTVHGNFLAKGVMDMLEMNWKTWASTNNVVRTFGNVQATEIPHLTITPDDRGRLRHQEKSGRNTDRYRIYGAASSEDGC